MSRSHGPLPAPSPVDPFSPAERLDEVARILALGVLRLRSRHAQKNHNNLNYLREFGLDFSAEESVSGLEPAESGEGR